MLLVGEYLLFSKEFVEPVDRGGDIQLLGKRMRVGLVEQGKWTGGSEGDPVGLSPENGDRLCQRILAAEDCSTAVR